jgi:hypothetical protein
MQVPYFQTLYGSPVVGPDQVWALPWSECELWRLQQKIMFEIR